MDGRVDEMLLVGEADLRAGEAALSEQLGQPVEGSAAASWAGLLADPDPQPGASLVIITGGNVAPA